MKIDCAVLSNSREGTSVKITEKPLSSIVVSALVDALCDKMGSYICSPPEWSFKIRWGREDEDGYTDKSLGHYWFNFGQWSHLWGYKREREIASIPVTYEWVHEYYPNVGWPWDGSSEDGMVSRSSDEGDILL